jgi:hypothetical protein
LIAPTDAVRIPESHIDTGAAEVNPKWINSRMAAMTNSGIIGGDL